MTTPSGYSVQVPGHGRMVLLNQADAVDRAARHRTHVTPLYSIPQIIAALEKSAEHPDRTGDTQFQVDVQEAVSLIRGLSLEVLS